VATVCMNLNAAKKISLKECAEAVIIVCSTTGNGDCPENADVWWRSVKVRSAVCICTQRPHILYLLLIFIGERHVRVDEIYCSWFRGYKLR
jgi:sulfite reductase alpha subunit-like flavoprotein